MSVVYQNPLVERYGSKEMLYNFSAEKKFSTWRKLWLALAKEQQKLGLPISDNQINEIAENIGNIDFQAAAKYEKQFRHDVMAHVHTLGDIAPLARPIIHLGATSAFVGDNTDLIQIRDGLDILLKKLVNVIDKLAQFAEQYKDLPTLGFTHFQPAQLTTVGKRATLWIQSLLLDIEELEFRKKSLKFRGVKGTTGTGASFKDLFNGDYEKLVALDKNISEHFGFDKRFAVTGQTYDRKTDYQVLSLLSNIAQSAHKFTNDLRLLQSLKEIEEPFATHQIGSSAMAYKRNPMRSERISALSKFVISLTSNPAMVAATQWFERTLDDSANKRLSMPQAMIATDAILEIWINVVDGLVVYPKSIHRRIMEELPFMATEYIIMQGVKSGGDRQTLHEKIRQHSIKAAEQVKVHGKPNDLIERITSDKDFSINSEKLFNLLNPTNFIGFAVEQTQDFLKNEVNPYIVKYMDLIGLDVNLKV